MKLKLWSGVHVCLFVCLFCLFCLFIMLHLRLMSSAAAYVLFYSRRDVKWNPEVCRFFKSIFVFVYSIGRYFASRLGASGGV
jgi:hypothetical protein